MKNKCNCGTGHFGYHDVSCLVHKGYVSEPSSLSDTKCQRVDCAAYIKDRKLKTNKCCKLYDSVIVQQTPYHVGQACLFFTTTPTTSIPVKKRDGLLDHKRLSIGKLKIQKAEKKELEADNKNMVRFILEIGCTEGSEQILNMVENFLDARK